MGDWKPYMTIALAGMTVDFWRVPAPGAKGVPK
jgi:hypothetical protein